MAEDTLQTRDSKKQDMTAEPHGKPKKANLKIDWMGKPISRTDRACSLLVFRNVYFRYRVIHPDPGNNTRNALTFHRAITRNKTIMNHESFRKRTELPANRQASRPFGQGCGFSVCQLHLEVVKNLKILV